MTGAAPMTTMEQDTLEVLLELRFPARADRLKLIRGSIRAAARMCGFDDTTAQNIVLAVDEACQNIIIHGYGEREDGEILLCISRRADGIQVCLRDSAPLVDPATIRPRLLTDIRPGKLGSHFIRAIMDSADYRPRTDCAGNILEMIKRLDGTS